MTFATMSQWLLIKVFELHPLSCHFGVTSADLVRHFPSRIDELNEETMVEVTD